VFARGRNGGLIVAVGTLATTHRDLIVKLITPYRHAASALEGYLQHIYGRSHLSRPLCRLC
jgi:hypothetical protein